MSVGTVSRLPDIIALTSQSLAAADNVLYCFGLLPAESAGRVTIEQPPDITLHVVRWFWIV
jgi:hypothetical protein